MRAINLAFLALSAALVGCVTVPPAPSCPPCPQAEQPRPAAQPVKTHQPAQWSDLPGWEDEDHAAVLELFRAQCSTLARRALWTSTCDAIKKVDGGGTAEKEGKRASEVGNKVTNKVTNELGKEAARAAERARARAWFETHFRPWALVNQDGGLEGLVTGYFEPLIRGSRLRKPPYLTPVFGPPEDLIVVDLAGLYPELRHMRLRGRIEGRRLVPYFSREEWAAEEERRSDQALLWVDDPIDFFFLQIQGSGQVLLDDGSRVRIGFADHNGHPYRSIGRWLIDQGELKSHEASMQGIRAWVAANPVRKKELLNVNPGFVFFRELPVEGSGPPGALGIPLTPERSVAIDPRFTPLGAPVWLSTTRPNSEAPLVRFMLAQDTGGAIRGPVRVDFYWGTGTAAGELAGRMKQRGRLWVLLPRDHAP